MLPVCNTVLHIYRTYPPSPKCYAAADFYNYIILLMSMCRISKFCTVGNTVKKVYLNKLLTHDRASDNSYCPYYKDYTLMRGDG